MRTPKGHLASLTRTLRRLARYGDQKGFNAYVASAAFGGAFNALDPGLRRTAMLAYVEASAACERNAGSVLRKPTPLNNRTAKDVTIWTRPENMARLVAAFAKTSDPVEAARLLRVTPGSARLAQRRHLQANATLHCNRAA